MNQQIRKSSEFSSSPTLCIFSIKPSIFFGRPSYFYMWSGRVQHGGRLAAKLCGMKLNKNKNRTLCLCVCVRSGWQRNTDGLNYPHIHTHPPTQLNLWVRKEKYTCGVRGEANSCSDFSLSIVSVSSSLNSGMMCWSVANVKTCRYPSQFLSRGLKKDLTVVCVSLCFYRLCELVEHTLEIRIRSKEINILGSVSM